MENEHLNQRNISMRDVDVLERVIKWLRLRQDQENSNLFYFAAGSAAGEIEEMVTTRHSTHRAYVEGSNEA